MFSYQQYTFDCLVINIHNSSILSKNFWWLQSPPVSHVITMKLDFNTSDNF